MGDPVGIFARDRQALRRVQRTAREELPADWLPIIAAEASQARPEWGGAVGHPSAQREVWRGWLGEFGGAAAADLTDAQIKVQAEAYALEARSMDLGEWADARPWSEFARLLEFCHAREVDPPPVGLLLRGMVARVRCRYWWRRALRRMVARRCERGALALGIVCKPAGQPYASNRAVWRRVDQNARNRGAAERITFENDAGYRRTLAELAAASVSNKAIRRGELMTRIRGCEEIADECGHPGLFLTLTCPSRFHSTLRDGTRNPKHDGSTPREAQDWLRVQWARARAKLAREKVRTYGFRVAEPHHDGCTHWHALLWFESQAQAEQAEAIIRARWLSDDGDEPGADRYRINAKRMEKGGAAGYVAKYIAKNIDDHAITHHTDDYAEGAIGPDLLGDVEIKPSMRVEAWAATWGIRQFQAIGQPPVTVWRELRRVKEREARAAGVGGTIHKAWLAAQRVGDVLADWARYVRAQGGLMLGRRCRIVLRRDARECDGQYGRAVRAFPVGVALNIACASTVWSERRLWRAVDSSTQAEAAGKGMSPRLAARSAAPRTGVNNCTDMSASDCHGGRPMGRRPETDDADAIRLDFLRGQGGLNVRETHESLDPGGGYRPHRPHPSGHARDSGALRGNHLAEIQRADR